MLSVGTKSLLFGAHWPPHVLAVAMAWRWLYGQWPTWREAVAICVHDIGYLGCKEMDGEDGTRHPELGARVAERLLGGEYGDLVRGHSKGYAELVGVGLSKLYPPDKLSIVFESAWLYVLRARATGELQQYRCVHRGGRVRVNDTSVSDAHWFRVVRARMIRGGLAHAIELLAPDGLGKARGR